jgi:hypothetical protein
MIDTCEKNDMMITDGRVETKYIWIINKVYIINSERISSIQLRQLVYGHCQFCIAIQCHCDSS